MFSIAFYQEHFKVRYVPRGLFTWVFFAVCLLAVIVLPFIIGLAMQNFWTENNYFVQMPSVNFTGRCALRVSTQLGKEYLWTCSDVFNSQFLTGTSLAVSPFFSLYQDDENADLKVDVVTFTLTVPIDSTQRTLYETLEQLRAGVAADEAVPNPVPASQPLDAIKEVTFLPEFVYTIDHYLVKVNMTAAPLLQFRNTDPSLASAANSSERPSGGPLCAVTEADLVFHSTERLINSPYVRYTHTYTDSPFVEWARQPSDLLNLPNFARHFTSRNQSVVTRRYAEVTGGLEILRAQAGLAPVGSATVVPGGLWNDMDLLNSFTWVVRLRVPKAEVKYVPSYAESIKWAWVQYFVIAYLLQWFFWKVRGLLATQGLLDTNAIYQATRIK